MRARLSVKGAPYRATRKRRSLPGRIPSLRLRYASRVILFSRFRLTAPPHPRATTTVNRVVGLPLVLNRSFIPLDSTLRAAENMPLMSLLLRSRSCLVRLLFIRGRKLDTTFCAATLQNEPASLGGHARAEAEFTRPFRFTGLIRTLHRNMLLAYPDEQVFLSQVCQENIGGKPLSVNSPHRHA